MTKAYHTSQILKVALPVPLRQLFDYLPPLENIISPLPGMRVLVPFGRQKIIGVIVEVKNKSDHPLEKIKRAYAILDPAPLFPNTMLQLIQWASRYYHSPLGLVFEAALPNRLRKVEPALLPNKKPQNKKTSTSQLKAEMALTTTLTSSIHESYLSLNSAQQQAVATISQCFGQFKTFLLEGVTGSGKTEVYIRLTEEALRHGRQALILVPEIGLTPQLVARFEARFSQPIAVLNSSLTEKKRLTAWENASTGIAPIVIGTRLSTFVPLQSPGIFIIDEEHDPSFKQQEGFRYHARDLMIMRGSLESCPVVLGSATPSLETLHNVHTGRFQSLKLPLRAGNAMLPTVQVLDIRHKKLEAGLSAQLIEKIREHIDKKGQILLFLNRRGYAPIWMCFGCGFVTLCKNCDAKMTLHYHLQQLHCHHCESVAPLHPECPICKSNSLRPVGIGTERLEVALQKHFPTQSIIRIDRDTTRKKGATQEILDRIHSGNANILLGTQMIAKGHHFPNVTLVAILDIDQGLFSVDFRSLEKLGQLITQVAGRSGRGERIGEVILQTCHPEHPLLKKVLEEGYANFANTLLIERQSVHLPPYSHQVLIRSEANQLERALEFLSFIKLSFFQNSTSNLKILGPIPAPMEKRQGKYRAQLLFQAPQRSSLQKLLQATIPKIDSHAVLQKVRWSLDVDPIDMY